MFYAKQEKPGSLAQFSRRYVLQSVIGEGGMGTVYDAFDRLTGKQIALKQVVAFQPDAIENTLLSSPEAQRMALAREFQILASLRHPNIIDVLDYGFDQDHHPFFTMELLNHPQSITDATAGQSLDIKIDRFAQLLRALIYLHQRQILHRDLKPTNILVENNMVKVVDFGLSTTTVSANDTAGRLAGTLFYLAPELFDGAPVSVASDLYALGMIAYQLFTEKNPFDETLDFNLLIDQVINWKPYLLLFDFPEPLKAIIERLLVKNPADRFATVRDVFTELSQTVAPGLLIETESTRESFLQASHFVGREIELVKLNLALDATQNGNGGIYLIGGESGVGKSRLLREVKTRAEVQGNLIITGQAITESTVPYQLWRECFMWLAILNDLTAEESGILKSVLPDIAAIVGHHVPDLPASSAKAAQERLHQTVGKLLVQQPTPLLILLEDLQWAKVDDLDLLAYLSDLAPHAAFLVVGNYFSFP